MIIGPVISGFSPNEKRSHFHIFDHSIITFGGGYLCLGFSKTSHVESFDRFETVVIKKANNVVDIFRIYTRCQEDKN